VHPRHIPLVAALKCFKSINQFDYIVATSEIYSSSVYPLTDLQQTVSDFKSSSLDPKAERRIKYEMEKWRRLEKAVEIDLKLLKKSYKAIKQTQTKRHLEARKRTVKINKDIRINRGKIAKIEERLQPSNNGKTI
jgi:hypothetical protein